MVDIFEVGPRDGLQNEKQVLPLEDKIWLIEALSKSGIKSMEVGAFVRADKIPQMADSDLIQKGLKKNLNTEFWYLVPNLKGLERALAIGVKNIAIFTAVSDSFNRNNIGLSVQESFQVIDQVVERATIAGVKIRAYASTVWGCPFEGRISPAKALPVLERLLALPIEQLSIGDTIGVAAPNGVREILKPLIKAHPLSKLAVHFHDTRGGALANAFASYELGIRTFDASIGGLGGCPFAPGASGNLATEDLAYLFKEMGIETGIDYSALCETSLELSKRMGNRALPSRALKAFQVNASSTNKTANNVWDK